MLACDAASTQLTAADRMYGAAAPCAFHLAWLAARAMGAGPAELHARVGAMPEAGRPLLWFHGASAGEMAAAGRLTAALRAHGYRFTAAYTATNRAGVEFIGRTEPHAVAAFAPWDHPRWVGRALDQWQPHGLFLVETELWPRLILEARRRDIPVFCVSARVYPRDVARYRLIRSLTVPMLGRLTGIFVQSDLERQRFITLGAAPERCMVSGNLKYLAGAASAVAEMSLRNELAVDGAHRVVVCGSVHTDEVPFVCAALARLSGDDIRVIIAPRHASAVGTIIRECRERNWRVHLRSAGRPAADWRVIVLDRMGDLARAYAIASVAVVGGGFGKHGGHNPLEPVMTGTPVIFGPHFGHFESEALALAALVPEAQVDSAPQLGQRLAEWLASEPHRGRVVELQRQAVPDGAAIARRYIDALRPWLGGLQA